MNCKQLLWLHVLIALMLVRQLGQLGFTQPTFICHIYFQVKGHCVPGSCGCKRLLNFAISRRQKKLVASARYVYVNPHATLCDEWRRYVMWRDVSWRCSLLTNRVFQLVRFRQQFKTKSQFWAVAHQSVDTLMHNRKLNAWQFKMNSNGRDINFNMCYIKWYSSAYVLLNKYELIDIFFLYSISVSSIKIKENK